MKILFVHNSITGSCDHVVKIVQNVIKDKIADASFQTIHFHKFMNEQKRGINPQMPEFDVLIFGTWADCFDLSLAGRQFLPTLQIKDKFFAGFVTYGGNPGKCDKTIIKFARAQKCKFIGYDSFAFGSSAIKDGEVTTVPSSLNQQINQFADFIAEALVSKQVPETISFRSGLFAAAMAPTMNFLAPGSGRLKLMYGGALSVDADKCAGCGFCANNCPENVIELIDGKSHFKNPKGCVQCGGCIQRCPNNAIMAGGKPFVQKKFEPWMVSDKSGKQPVDVLKADFQK